MLLLQKKGWKGANFIPLNSDRVRKEQNQGRLTATDITMKCKRNKPVEQNQKKCKNIFTTDHNFQYLICFQKYWERKRKQTNFSSALNVFHSKRKKKISLRWKGMLWDLLELPAKYHWVLEGPTFTRTPALGGASETYLGLLKLCTKQEWISIFSSQICVLPTKHTNTTFPVVCGNWLFFAGSYIRESNYFPRADKTRSAGALICSAWEGQGDSAPYVP